MGSSADGLVGGGVTSRVPVAFGRVVRRLVAWGGLVCLVCSAGASASPRFIQAPGSPFRTGENPESVAFNPDGRLLATANANAQNISLFAVDPRTHALRRVAGSPFRAGSGPFSVAFSPNGRALAAANLSDNTVSVFSVDSGTHALRQVPGSPFSTGSSGTRPRSVAFSPDASLLAAVNSPDQPNPGTVSMFSVDPGTQALSAVGGSPFATGRSPYSVAFSPAGGLLATANRGDGTLSVFSVDPSSHALSQVIGSPFGAGVSSGAPDSVAFAPDGHLLATATAPDLPGNGPGTVSLFSVDPSTHTLTQVAAPRVTGSDSESVTFGSGGGLLATASALDFDVSVFSVDPSTHALTQVAGSPFQTADTPSAVAFSPDGKAFATTTFSPSEAGRVAVFAAAVCRGATGRLRGLTLGPVKLGMTRAHLRRAFQGGYSTTGHYTDSLCLKPSGAIEAGYPSPMLLASVSKAKRRRIGGRVVLAVTGARHYALDGVRPGSRLSAVPARLRTGAPFHIAGRTWYLADAGLGQAVLEVRHGRIEQIGIADQLLTRSRRAARQLLAGVS